MCREQYGRYGGLLKCLSVRTTGMSAPKGGTDIKSSKISRNDWLTEIFRFIITYANDSIATGKQTVWLTQNSN